MRKPILLALIAVLVIAAGCTPAQGPVSTDTPAPSRTTEATLSPTTEPTAEAATGTPAATATAPEPTVTSPSTVATMEAYPVNPEQIAALNGMGLDLLQRLDGTAPAGTNLFISPVSIALALGMAANGAEGDTLSGMLEALHLSDWDQTTANEAMAGLSQSLTDEDLGVTLEIANSLWLRQGLPFRESFLSVVQAYYAAQIASLNLDDPAAADAINQWASDATHGRISQIVTPPIDPQMILYIINAVYFKGDWQDPFDESLTLEKPFTREDGSTVQADLMSRYGSYGYVDTGDYQAVRLPYAGDRLSMIVVLPADAAGADALLTSMNATDWQALAAGLSSADGTVELPRFKLSFASTLNGTLAGMGMADAFDPGTADLSRIHELEEPTWISQVLHKTFVEVNEEGTEAAAVTSIGIAALSAPMEPPFSYIADHPFLYAIQDDASGAMLFLGVMCDPTQEEVELPG